MSLPGSAHAHGDAVMSATLRSVPEDFIVDEIEAFAPSSDGEHLLLEVEKRAMTTQHAAQRLADWAGVPVSAVGYAGMKDRHALTRQRYSVHLPKRQAPPLDTLESAAAGLNPEQRLRVLSQAWHARKLPRGAHAGNRFRLLLRDVHGDAASIERRLQEIATNGVPNFFGGQRFGHGAGNVDKALAMFRHANPSQESAHPGADLQGRRRVRREERTHLLSAARSALFNRVLAARLQDGSWNRGLEGEVWVLDGSRSVFGPEPWSELLAARLAAFDIHPSAPLWGRGELRTSGTARVLEEATLGDVESLALRQGIEQAGMRQERRATRLQPRELAWAWQGGDVLELGFVLPPGGYATTVLAEIGDLRDAGAAKYYRSSDQAVLDWNAASSSV
ncbi:MAG: tRNA pseudouridine(13) synthase TruD [Pseudomonadota bacterium]|nr:tRNA pseudouridine(13) synthase TruD [Pseudomonadota bacterium]